MVIGAGDSLIVAEAFKKLKKISCISEGYSLKFYTDREIRNNKVKEGHIHEADIIMADFMQSEFDSFLAGSLKEKKVKIYSLRCAYMADKLKKQGMKPDIRTEKYYSPPTIDNIKNLVLLAISKEGEKISYAPPFTLPESGIFHPDAQKIFPDFEAYFKWYCTSGKYSEKGFWLGIHTFHTSVSEESGKIQAHIIRALEREGINTLPVFGRPPYHKSLKKYFLDAGGQPRVQILIGFSFRFLRGFREETEKILCQINAPVFMPIIAHAITIDQWKRSIEGISPMRVAWQLCMPEQNGAIEPSMVGGKSAARLKGMTDVVYDTIPMPDNIDFLIRRIKAWHNIQVKPNAEKKIAILYWNHPPGKQNVGASYMNLFRSIANILPAMKKNGYKIEGRLLTEE
ncbi:cobaltochelatase subunit CobN, partial [bacterium]|nr:cobaltochelatase subunit CobN [bacterium]